MSSSALPSWIGSLADGGIAADMAAAAADGTVSYSEMLKVFADVGAGLTSSRAVLSINQFASLKTIAADLGSGLSVSSYVQNITGSLVNGSAANARWTGGATSASALGNLAAGCSATKLGELVGKWYLGTDLPCATVSMSGSSTFTVSYQSVNKPLFAVGGPSMNDVNQGYLGDCYVLSALAEVANENPSIIGSMIQSNGNNTFGVRLYIGGQANWVTVNNALANNGTVFNNGPDMWAGLVEKAYAQLQGSGVLTGNGGANYGNSWSSIGNGGVPDYALQEITGASAITELYANGASWGSYTYSPVGAYIPATGATGLSTASVLSTLAADLKSGYDLVLSSNTNAYDSAHKQTLVAGHALSVIGIDSANNNLIIRNPWGTVAGQYWDTTFEVSLNSLLADHDVISVDNVSTGGPTVASQTANLSEIAGKSFSYTLAANTFADPKGLALTETATLANGQALPSWLSFDAASGTFSGTPMNAGVVTVKVTANDTDGLSASETFSIAVAAPPTVTAQTANLTEAVGKSFSYALAGNTFTDPQGSALTLKATQSAGQALPSWLFFNAATGTFSGTPTAAGTTSVMVTATDALGLSSPETFSITVAAPPTVTAHTANFTETAGKSFSYALAGNTFTDPQHSALTLKATQSNGQALPSWLSFDAATGTFSGTPAAAGITSVMVIATDALGLSSPETFSITVAAPPTVTAQTPNLTESTGKSFSYALAGNAFTDPQHSALTLKATQSNGQALPSWLAFNAATRTFSGTPSAAGTTSVTVTATDTLGLSVSETFSVTAVVPPTVTAHTANLTELAGKSFSYTLAANTFTDPGGSALTLKATQSTGQALPSWLSFNVATGTFGGTPTAAGTTSVTVTATDAVGVSSPETFSIAVVAPPTITAHTANLTETVGKSFSYALAANTFTDPQHSALTLKATQSDGQALPSWLSFNAATRTFSGTPSAAGTTSVMVNATDALGLAAAESFSITATGPALARQTASQTWTLGQTINLGLPANTFSNTRSMTYSAEQILGSGDVAAAGWLHFNPATDTFAGTVAANESGTLRLAVIARDASGATATDAFNISFKNSQGLTVGAMSAIPVGQQQQTHVHLAVR